MSTFLLVHPIQKDMKLARKYSIICCGLFIFCIQVFTLFGSIAYLIRHIDDLSEILYPFFQAVMLVCSISSFLIGVINRRRFEKLTRKIQQIYDSSKKLELDFSLNIILVTSTFNSKNMQAKMKTLRNCWRMQTREMNGKSIFIWKNFYHPMLYRQFYWFWVWWHIPYMWMDISTLNDRFRHSVQC